jgi:ribonuclease BN (tRNA processing enzyme)
MDAMLASKRERPLVIAGPHGTETHLSHLREALFPGSHAMTPRFPLAYRELEPGATHAVLDVAVTPRTARHVPETHATALRVEVGGRVIAYTGDTEWTDEVARIAAGADLLIAECYFYAKRIKWHLTYDAIAEHVRRAGAKRVILTHMSREMLAHRGDVAEECAEDGMVVEL